MTLCQKGHMISEIATCYKTSQRSASSWKNGILHPKRTQVDRRADRDNAQEWCDRRVEQPICLQCSSCRKEGRSRRRNGSPMHKLCTIKQGHYTRPIPITQHQ